MFKKLLYNRNEETFLCVIFLLLLIIAVYNWIIALLVGIVIGGGNFWRGRTSNAIDRTKADQIGMLATIMNCIYVSEICRAEGMQTAVLTPFECGTFTKLFSKDIIKLYHAHIVIYSFPGFTLF